MKTFLTVAMLLSLNANAATSQYVKKSWCLPSTAYRMIVVAKKGNKYLVAQGGAGLNSSGVVEFVTTQINYSGASLNALVQYVGTKTIEGSDGFNHQVDEWRECKKLNNR